jgi:four helix bundle protein
VMRRRSREEGMTTEKPTRTSAKRFEDLEVWQHAHKMVLAVYRVTKEYPAEERFGLISQMRRASVAIAANCAEGFKKRGTKDKMNFYNVAQGSLEELRYYLILSKDLGYSDGDGALREEIDIVGRMLYRLVCSIRIQ